MSTLTLTPQSRYIVVGGTGTFAVIAKGKQRFDSFQITVDFDSEVLECSSAAVPAATAAIYTDAVTADIDNGRGLLRFASSAALADVVDLTDSITLLEITFSAIEPNAGSAVTLRTTPAVIHDLGDGVTNQLGPAQILPCGLAINGQDVLTGVENAAIVTFPMPDVPTALRSSTNRTRNDIIGQAYRKVLGPSRLSGDQMREGADVLNDILREESLRLTRGEKAVWTISRGALFLRVGQVAYGTAEQWIGQEGGMVRRVDSTNAEFGGVGLLPTPVPDLIPTTHHEASGTAPTGTLTSAQAYAQFAGLSADIEELLSAQYRDMSGDDVPLRLITREQYNAISAKTDRGEPECLMFVRAADRAQQQIVLDYASSVGAPDTTPDTVIGSDGNVYSCLIAHTSSRYNRPVDGADWQTFWCKQGLDGDQWVDATAYTSAPAVLYTYRRRILTFDNAGDVPDMPEGWERYLIYRLAYDLGADHGITMEQMQWLKAEYLSAYETLFQSARETQNDHHDKATYF